MGGLCSECRSDSVFRDGALVSIVIAYCGATRCVRSSLRDVYERDCQGLRVVYISSYSASRAPVLIHRFVQGRREVEFVHAHGGDKLSTSEGLNLRGYGKGCIVFVSNSSYLVPGTVTGLCTRVGGSVRIIVKDAVISCRKKQSICN